MLAHVLALCYFLLLFFLNDPATTEIYTLSLHDALPIWLNAREQASSAASSRFIRHPPPSPSLAREGSRRPSRLLDRPEAIRSEEHTSELQSQFHLVCRLLLEKKKKKTIRPTQEQTKQIF